MIQFTDSKDVATQACGLRHKYFLSPDSASSLLLLVHGRAGDRSVMTPFASLVKQDTHIFLPEAWLEDQKGGFSWWTIAESEQNASLSSVAERERSLEKLSRFIERIQLFYQFKPKKIVIVGFSQGAAMCSLLIQSNPKQYVGFVSLAGFIIESNNRNFLEATDLPRVLMAHGENDQIVSMERAILGKEYLESKGFLVDLVTDPVAHKVGTAGMKAVREFLQEVLL